MHSKYGQALFIPLSLYDPRLADLELLHLELLRTIDQTALSVLTAVDEVRVVEGKLDSTVDSIVNSLDTQHKRVVLVSDLVLPRTETATGENVLVVQVRKDLLESSVTLQSGGGVAVVETAVVGADNFVTGLKPVQDLLDIVSV